MMYVHRCRWRLDIERDNRAASVQQASSRGIADARCGTREDNGFIRDHCLHDRSLERQLAIPLILAVMLTALLTPIACNGGGGGNNQDGNPLIQGEALRQDVVLDHSNGINVPTIYWEYAPGDPRLTIAPELSVELTSDDYFNQCDPAMAAVIND